MSSRDFGWGSWEQELQEQELQQEKHDFKGKTNTNTRNMGDLQQNWPLFTSIYDENFFYSKYKKIFFLKSSRYGLVKFEISLQVILWFKG